MVHFNVHEPLTAWKCSNRHCRRFLIEGNCAGFDGIGMRAPERFERSRGRKLAAWSGPLSPWPGGGCHLVNNSSIATAHTIGCVAGSTRTAHAVIYDFFWPAFVADDGR